MDFIHFNDRIFRKEDFRKVIAAKNKIAIYLKNDKPWVLECEKEEEAKGLMRQLVNDLNSKND